jgi:hypothetical protein
VEQIENRSMTWLGKARIFSAMIVALAVLAWITATNHCVLGLMRQPREQAVSASHCPGHTTESDGARDGGSGMLACCQGLLSPNFEAAKAKVPFPVLVATQLAGVDRLILQPQDPRSVLPSTEYDTGPPPAGFFVGTVLRRSLPENAPPPAS